MTEYARRTRVGAGMTENHAEFEVLNIQVKDILVNDLVEAETSGWHAVTSLSPGFCLGDVMIEHGPEWSSVPGTAVIEVRRPL